MILRHADTSAVAAISQTSTTLQPPLVLVVDDVKEVRFTISLFLHHSGFRVLEAEDGLAAQLILMLEHPALVISDLEMPNGNGWDLLEYCHAEHPGLPVLLSSGGPLGQRPEIERWAVGFIPKPSSMDQFRHEVLRALSLAA